MSRQHTCISPELANTLAIANNSINNSSNDTITRFHLQEEVNLMMCDAWSLGILL